MSAEYALFSKEENEILTRTGPGTPMGKLLRRYWLPAIKSEELSVSGGDQLRLKLLGEDLIVFRSTDAVLVSWTNLVRIAGQICFLPVMKNAVYVVLTMVGNLTLMETLSKFLPTLTLNSGSRSPG